MYKDLCRVKKAFQNSLIFVQVANNNTFYTIITTGISISLFNLLHLFNVLYLYIFQYICNINMYKRHENFYLYEICRFVQRS